MSDVAVGTIAPALGAGAAAPVPARRSARTAGLVLILAATVLLPALALAALAWQAWDETWAAARREVARGAEAGAEYALRVHEGQRLAADRVNDMLRGLSDEEIRAREAALHAELRALMPRIPLASSIYVFDRQGGVLVSANVYPAPREMSVADREWMRVLGAPGAPQTFVSRVHLGRIDSVLFYAISRRRSGSGNGLSEDAFDGVVNVSVNPNTIAAGFAALVGETGDIPALVRADGEVLARAPGFPRPLPPVPADSPLRAAAAAGETRGTYMGRTLGLQQDPRGETRLISFRRVGDLPLYVTMARPSAAIRAQWRATVTRQLAVGVPTMLALAGLALLALQRARAAEAAEAALRREAAEREQAELRRAAEARFRGIFESRVMGMSVFDLATGETPLVNDRLLEMTGSSRAEFEAGRWDWRPATPPEHLPLDERAIAEARRRGWWDPYEKEYRRPDGTRLPVRIASAPLPGEPGRLVVLVQDITEQREAELRRELLLREVDHRAKNALATARAALRLTRAPTQEAFVRELDGRIGALAQAIALLARTHWEGVEIGTLLAGELAPFLGTAEAGGAPAAAAARVTLDGPPLMVAAAAVQPLAMAVHELATNAIKYGALSLPDGSVTIRWQRLAEAPARLRLTWHEQGGPPVAAPPEERGFGTRVLRATLERQLGGRVTQHWEATGLRCEILLPAARALAPGDAPGDAGGNARGARNDTATADAFCDTRG